MKQAWMAAWLLLAWWSHTQAGELLYNGIELPDQWPPKTGKLGSEPMPVPYLKHRPQVVPVDVGRQLWVDDFLIEETTLKRTFHQPVYHANSPVLKPDQAWEQDEKESHAAPYSDGVWYDPQQKKFLMWYETAGRKTCLAESKDGIQWTKPDLPVEPGTNIVLRTIRDSNTVWLDHTAKNPAERFKLAEARYKNRAWEMALRTSADGVKWSEEQSVSGPSWDRSTMFYNPFRQVWVGSVRGHPQVKPDPVVRMRNYFEGRTLVDALSWKQHTDQVAQGNLLPNDLQPWIGSDRLDPHHPDPRFAALVPQLYNLDAFPYESLMVGLFTIWQGPSNEICKELNIHKRNEVLVGFSRDGFHWDRTNRQRFLPVSDNQQHWNAANVQSVGGGCVVWRDRMYFYCSGRTMQPRSTTSTGLAVLRRDGFASLDAGANGGFVTTRLIKFRGKHLFVNATPGSGTLQVEILDEQGKVIPGYSLTDCRPVTGDSTQAAVVFPADLSALAQKPVRLRFTLSHGAMYSFWVSHATTGHSGGYVSAGSPDYPGVQDVAE